jgi:hypothetical protein
MKDDDDLPAPWQKYALAAVAYAIGALVLCLVPVNVPIWVIAVVPWLLAIFNVQWAWQKWSREHEG